MVQIHPNLFVGSQLDYEHNVRYQDGWAIVHACREPYHRAALGYRGGSAPKHDSEYLVARRGSRLILNLIDADNPAYIPKEIMDRSLAFIQESLGQDTRVLVHCNQGRSRGPAIGLLYLASHTDVLSGLRYASAHDRYRELYPDYNPAPGVRRFLVANWSTYCRGHFTDNETDADEDREQADACAETV